MTEPLRVLVVEDDDDDAVLLVHHLRRSGFEVEARVVATQEAVRAALAVRQGPDVVLVDWTLPAMTALDVIDIVREQPEPPPVIVVSGTMDDETTVEAIRRGAADYLLKDRLRRLGPSVAAARARARLAAEAAAATERERMTANLLRALVRHCPAAIGLYDRTGRRLFSNPPHDRLPHSPVAGDPPERARIAEDPIGQRHYLSVAYPVEDDRGAVLGSGYIHLDVTEQVQLRCEVEQAHRRLQERADALRAQNEALREIDATKDRIIATVSHELRTPLTSITGYVELLREGAMGEVNARAEAALDVVERNARRLLGLVDTLLLLSSVDDGSFLPRPSATPVAELVESACRALAPACSASRVTLDVDVSDAPDALVVDRELADRLLLNLLSNAVKFSRPAGGTVRLRVARTGAGEAAGVEIVVADEGVGIAAEDLPQLFTRFHRGRTAHRNEIPGTGLGLVLCREIARGHGGDVTVASTEGRGTTVTVRLPAAPPVPVPAPAAPDGAPAH